MFAASGTHNAHARFDRSRPTIVKLETIQIAWQYLRQLFTQQRFNFGGEVVAVHQLPGVLSHRFGDLRVAMAERCDVNARTEINVLIAVHILQRASFAGFERDGEQLHLAA